MLETFSPIRHSKEWIKQDHCQHDQSNNCWWTSKEFRGRSF